MKLQTTHKLFYHKWSYKVKCYCKGSWMIKRCGINYTISQCMTKKQSSGIYMRSDYDPVKLLEFVRDVSQFLDKDIHVRTEAGIFSIYCNDRKLFKQMIKKLSPWISEVFEPANDAEYQFMLDNGRKKVLCNHLPFQRYQYRVYVKERMDIGIREKLWSWMAKYDGKMRSPVRVAMWLMGEKSWVTNPSIYVEDGPTLSMFLLFLGDRVSYVEEFVPRSVINIQSKETTCLV